MIGLYLFLIFVSIAMLLEVSLTDEQQAHFKIQDRTKEDKDKWADSLSVYQKMLLMLFNASFAGFIVFIAYSLIKAFS